VDTPGCYSVDLPIPSDCRIAEVAGLRMLKAVVIAVAAAGLAVAPASAGRGLHVGVAEDAAI
jgi:hypothetical protein